MGRAVVVPNAVRQSASSRTRSEDCSPLSSASAVRASTAARARSGQSPPAWSATTTSGSQVSAARSSTGMAGSACFQVGEVGAQPGGESVGELRAGRGGRGGAGTGRRSRRGRGGACG